MVEPGNERDLALLLDMLLAARDALKFVAGIDEIGFLDSRLHQNAVIRSLEVIGEAAGKVSPAMQAKLPQVPWREITGMRHRLIHNYGDVRLDLVWSVVKERLGSVIAALELLIPQNGATRAFARTIGIDYSGAETPRSSLKGLRVYLADGDSSPVEILPPPSTKKYWTRRGIAEWLVEILGENTPTLVGIDHGFSFPLRYFEAHGLTPDWPTFLDYFQRYWPTDGDNMYLDSAALARQGNTRWRRLTEECAKGAKSVFHFNTPGSVAHSTHAGIPWLRFIRNQLGASVHFWPFDGWDMPDGRSAIVEVYPALWSKSFKTEGLTPDQHDAFSAAAWLSRIVSDGSIATHLNPALKPNERTLAQVEGWILGVQPRKP